MRKPRRPEPIRVTVTDADEWEVTRESIPGVGGVLLTISDPKSGDEIAALVTREAWAILTSDPV